MKGVEGFGGLLNGKEIQHSGMVHLVNIISTHIVHVDAPLPNPSMVFPMAREVQGHMIVESRSCLQKP